MTDDHTQTYDYIVMHSNAQGDGIAAVFADARDNPKVRKADLMAAALSGYHAALTLVRQRANDL